jgi:hypothetical protein
MAETKARAFPDRFSARVEQGVSQLLKAWRKQASRSDRVGDVSRGGLEMVHGGLRFAVRSLTRLERGTRPPLRMPTLASVVRRTRPKAGARRAAPAPRRQRTASAS